jgi:hypothetical protein
MSNSGFVDFIPEGKGTPSSGSLFRDFVPSPKLEKIPVKKEKPVVVLSEADIAAAKAMEDETVEENNVLAPSLEETPVLTEKEQINATEPHVKNRKSGKRKAGRK